MNPNEARDLFSEAYEGDLEQAQQAAFKEALANDEALQAEYDDFVSTLQMVHDLGKADDGLPPPDLLRGVQERLRNRSRGRYYRDRFAQRGPMNLMLSVMLAVTVLFLIAAAWYVMQSMVSIEEEPATSSEPVSPSAPAP
ncbi:MAG: anti-sigma factor [Sandaracinaceae bacterium]